MILNNYYMNICNNFRYFCDKTYCYLFCDINISTDIIYINELNNNNIIMNYLKTKYPNNCDICNIKILNNLKNKYSNNNFNLIENDKPIINIEIIPKYNDKPLIDKNKKPIIHNSIENDKSIINTKPNPITHTSIENDKPLIDKNKKPITHNSIENDKPLIDKNQKPITHNSIKNNNNRPTFYYYDKPIRAGGILFYKITNNNKYFLVIEEKGKYSDLGGKTEEYDENIYDTISREVYEESNGFFNKNEIYDMIIKKNNEEYLENAKYLLFIIELNINNNINNLQWILKNDFIKNHHERLKDIIQYI